ncbi:cupredoxin domain-containing protein [Geodermatophilus sp. URMC 64]
MVGCVLAAGALSGCGGAAGGDSPAASSSAAPDLGTVTTDAEGVQELTLQTQDDYVFTPDRFTVRPGPVRLTVINVATQLTHNFRFTPDALPEPITAEIPLLAPGDRQTIEFTVTAPGDYPFECSFHTQLGQVGTMTVGG